MKSKWFETALALIVLLIGPCATSWTQEKKNDIFSIAPAFSFAWYPYSNVLGEKSTHTEIDRNNFGMSAAMGLKLFDKVGAYVNLKIDDPSFKKLVDLAGYLTAYWFMIKFDYHSFGGTVTWAVDTPNPIPGGADYNFRNRLSNISLLFRADKVPILNDLILSPILTGAIFGIGIGYARFDMPLAYESQRFSAGLPYPGFGVVKGSPWGFSMLIDTLSYHMENYPANVQGIEGGTFLSLMSILYMIPIIGDLLVYTGITPWTYIDWFLGVFGKKGVKTDAGAISWMSDANGVPVDVAINELAYITLKLNLGIQRVWGVGKKGLIGLAAGVEILVSWH